jgi:hypothetical protein
MRSRVERFARALAFGPLAVQILASCSTLTSVVSVSPVERTSPTARLVWRQTT